jgi:hypothetical protein
MAGHSRPKDGVLSHAYVPAMTAEATGCCLSVVVPALVAGIHVLHALQQQKRGWPGQARP